MNKRPFSKLQTRRLFEKSTYINPEIVTVIHKREIKEFYHIFLFTGTFIAQIPKNTMK